MTKKIYVSCLVSLLIIAALGIWAAPYRNADKLIKAIEVRDVYKVEQLLASGTDPNHNTSVKSNLLSTLFDIVPQRPLAAACSTGDLEIVRLLIDHGATAESIDGYGWSPLRETLFYYQPDDLEIIRLLLENGADASAAEADELPVFSAARMVPRVYDPSKANGTVFATGYDEETAKGITEIVALLWDDSSVHTGPGERTLLMYAVMQENTYLTEYLLSKGCATDITDYHGKTAFDYALESGNEAIIALLAAAR